MACSSRQCWCGCVSLGTSALWIQNGQGQAAGIEAHLPGRRVFFLSLVTHLLLIHLLRPDAEDVSEGLEVVSKDILCYQAPAEPWQLPAHQLCPCGKRCVTQPSFALVLPAELN